MRSALLTVAFILTIPLGALAQEAKPSPTPTPAPSPSPSPSAAPDISGKWTLGVDAGGTAVSLALELSQKGSEFSGTAASDVGGGKVEGGKLSGKTFTATLRADVQGQAVDFKMEGSLDGEKMSGTLSNAGFGTLAFSGARNK